MKKHSFAILAALLVSVPATMKAQEYVVPQTPPVVEPETVVVPDTVAETPTEEVKAVKEKKVKEKKVKEPKVKVIKEKNKEKTYGLFNHLGVGLAAGIMDGISANVGVPVGGHVALRAGYDFTSSVYSYKTVADLKTWDLGGGTTIDLSKTPVTADLSMKYYGLIDLYPSKKSAFHITAGLFGGNGEIAHVTADLTGVEQLSTDDYAKTSISYKEETDPGHITVSTDSKGFVHAGVRAKKNLMPYFGLGWGRVCNLKKSISLSLDLGLLKTSGLEIYARDYKLKQDSRITSATVDNHDSFDLTGKPLVGGLGKQEKLIDRAGNGDLPVLKDFLPCIRIGLNIRLF